MRIAVIGGEGFVGSSLKVDLDKKGFKSTSFDKIFEKGHDARLDVTDFSSLSILKGHEVIINLAAEHRDDVRPKSLYDDVNVKGAKNVCNAASKFKINTIIFTSSVAVYGFASPGTDENGEIKYFNDYGRTKYLAEQVYIEWQKKNPISRNLVIVRPTVIFGKGNRGNVYNLLNQIASKKFIMVGNGENIKSMAYVENISAFLSHCISYKEGIHIFNYIDKPDFTMNKLVSLTRKTIFNKNNVGIRLPFFIGYLIGYLADFISYIFRISLPVSSIRVKKFISTTQFSSSIDSEDFSPPVTVEHGLKETLEYEFIQNNCDKPTYKTE